MYTLRSTVHNTLELKRGPLDTESSALSTKTHASLTEQPKTSMYVLLVITRNVTYMADLCLPTISQLSLNITFGEEFIRVVI